MKTIKLSTLSIFVVLCNLCGFAQPATEIITLTGSLPETAIIQTKTNQIEINTLPCKIVLKQEDIPQTIKITSPNYTYSDIFIRKYTKADFKVARQSGDPIPRTYLIKYEKNATLYAPTGYPQQVHTVKQSPKSTEQELSSDVDKIESNITQNASNTFAVIIANEKYQETDNVEYAINDGNAFKLYCTNLLGIPEENIHFRTNATYTNMKADLMWLKRISDVYKGDCSIMVYYAGHGIPDEKTKGCSLLPVDGIPTDMTTTLSLSNVYKELANMQTQKTLVFLDACFSGTGRNDQMLSQARGVSIKPKTEKPQGNMIVFSSASGDETAFPYKEKKHGLFTYFLLKKLQATKGNVNLGELSDYIKSEVGKKAIVINSKPQTPIVSTSQEMNDKWRKIKLK